MDDFPAVLDLTYCKNWYIKFIVKLKKRLTQEFGNKIHFIDHPVGVRPKPYLIKLNGQKIFSILDPIDGEKKPIFFERHGYWGDPVPEDYERIVTKIRESFLWQQISK